MQGWQTQINSYVAEELVINMMTPLEQGISRQRINHPHNA